MKKTVKKNNDAISPVMRALSDYVAKAPRRALPAAVMERAKHHLLDTLSAMVSGSRLLPGQRAIEFAAVQGGNPEACVIGSSIVTSAITAALANGMHGHSDETDDTYYLALVHPGCSIVPAALAMGERGRANGTTLLRAMVLGYDVCARMSKTLGIEKFRSASCVIAPMVNTGLQAQALVRAAKYPPMGARSWGGYTAQQASGLTPADYLREANRMTMVFAMIETVEALENVEAIAATPGLDGLFVGPSDLSITLSRGAKVDKTGPETLAAMEKVAAAAQANGLVAGAFGGSAEVIRTYLGLGFAFIAAAVDVDLMQWGAAELNRALAGGARPV